MPGESKLFCKNFRERQCLFTLKLIWDSMDMSVLILRNILLSSTLSKCSISQLCTFYIFDKWAFLHKFHHQICSRINFWKWNFLIFALVTVMKMDRIKQRLRFAKEKLSFSTVLAKGKFVFKGKKIELSKLLNSCGKPWSASLPPNIHFCETSTCHTLTYMFNRNFNVFLH